MDTLPFPYYDMLISNTFFEFGDLTCSVERIEDGIKRGKIVDAEASILEKKMIIFYEHVQTMYKEKGNERKSCMTLDESVKNFSYSSSYTLIPLACSPPSRMST